MNEELRNALAMYLRDQATNQGGGKFAPPGGGPEGPGLPQVSVQDRGAPNPALSAQYSLPVGGGDVTLQGNLFKPDAQAPSNWGAMLGYRQPF